MYHLIRFFVCRLFLFVRRLFAVRSSFVRCSFIISSLFVRRSFVRHSFVVRSSFVQPPHPPWLIVMYHLIRDRSSFVLVSLSVRCCSFIVRSSFVCSTTSPAMADCYVPPHPRFCSSFVLVCSSFVRRSFVVCLLFFHHLFVVCSLYVCSLFVCRSFVVSLSFVRSLFVQPPHLPWLIVMYHLIRDFVCCLFSFVCRLFVICLSFIRCLFVVHLFVVCSTTSPTMDDCYVPPHPRSFVVCSHLFVVC